MPALFGDDNKLIRKIKKITDRLEKLKPGAYAPRVQVARKTLKY